MAAICNSQHLQRNKNAGQRTSNEWPSSFHGGFELIWFYEFCNVWFIPKTIFETFTKRILYSIQKQQQVTRKLCSYRGHQIEWVKTLRPSRNLPSHRAHEILLIQKWVINVKRFRKNKTFFTSLSKWRPMIWNNAHAQHTHTHIEKVLECSNFNSLSPCMEYDDLLSNESVLD